MAKPTFSRRSLALLAPTAALTAGLSGCVQGSATRSTGNGLSLWLTFTDNNQRDHYQENFVAPFNEQTTGVPLSLTIRGDDDALQRLQRTAIASGSGPDLVYTAGPSYGLEFVNAERFTSLDSYAEKNSWQDKVLPWAYEAGVLQGHNYMVPTSYETMIMVYNAAVFEEKGWDIPTNREEFEAFAAAAKDADMMPVGIGAGDWAAATEWLVSSFMNHAAGPEAVHDALTGSIGWDDQRIIDSIALLKDYFDQGWIGGGVESYFTNHEADLWIGLVNGTVGCLFIGSWAFSAMAPYFNDEAGNDDQWDWAPIPQFGDVTTKDLYAMGVGSTISVNSDSPRADEAAEYLDFLIQDPRAQLRSVADVSSQPLPLHYEPDDYPGDIDARVRRLYDSIDATDRIGFLSWTFWPPRSGVYTYEEMDRVIIGQLSPEEYCKGLDELFQEEYEGGKVPPIPDWQVEP
ncbi:ABC transporter substrate-binding protein [Brachybacterium sacelli]|uniref:Raffinose/stachyose/melibiose transport system substrate-binding protein n=1 Tax=Brachybacterium sacelli TaxID=173364 RepID=A0ABS4WYX3_9MICO|nr:ABC transporter substrate-binding protein [Brachybacterium sacelli]MBP2381411.1 raffinose/stachyose/melibiose transport system substrate-binding protein [Brachybacterium sacelli]